MEIARLLPFVEDAAQHLVKRHPGLVDFPALVRRQVMGVAEEERDLHAMRDLEGDEILHDLRKLGRRIAAKRRAEFHGLLRSSEERRVGQECVSRWSDWWCPD